MPQTEYRIVKMNGQIAWQRDRLFARYHAVSTGHDKAICGARPGLRSQGWSLIRGDAVTCPGCLRKLSAVADGGVASTI